MKAMAIPIAERIRLPITRALRRSVRSTYAPMGIAKKSQGSNERAESKLIRTGSSVSDTASRGAARRKTPSPRLVIKLALQIREKSLPSDLDDFCDLGVDTRRYLNLNAE